jgi:hypothetical protein
MVNIKTAFKSERLMKSITGMKTEEFNNLLITFKKVLETNQKIINKNKERKRKIGGGKKHTLDTAQKKLFFVLFYMKCYPTFDLASFYFGVDRSQTNRWTKAFLLSLEKTLGIEIVLPERKISSREEFERKFPEIKDIFVDGTERPIQRPKKAKNQKKNYSGKKKRHSKKNIVVSDEKKRDSFFRKN